MFPMTVSLVLISPRELAALASAVSGLSQAVNVPQMQIVGASATLAEPAVSENVASAEAKPKKEKPKTETSTTALTETAPVAIERVTVSQAAVKLAVKDKERAVAILAEFGVTAVKNLPDEHLASLHGKLTAALEELT